MPFGFVLPINVVAEFLTLKAVAIEMSEGFKELDELLAILLYHDGQVSAVEAIERLEKLELREMDAGVLEGGIVAFGLFGEFAEKLPMIVTFLGIKPGLIAAFAPARDVHFVEAGMALFFERGDNFGVRDAIVKHLVHLIADCGRQP